MSRKTIVALVVLGAVGYFGLSFAYRAAVHCPWPEVPFGAFATACKEPPAAKDDWEARENISGQLWPPPQSR